MTGWRTRRFHRRRDERGASLILVIAFLVIVSTMGAAVITSVASGLNDRGTLSQVRNREYAADGGIEAAIAQVRLNMTSGNSTPPNALSPCPTSPIAWSLNSVNVVVSCSYEPNSIGSYLQRNVIFSAGCDAAQPTGTACPSTNTQIIRAKVNFASLTPPTETSIAVSQTYIQAWSVNG